MLQGTYDPTKVSVSVAGNTIVGPFGEGTMVKCARAEDGFTLKVGADGGAARSRNANKSGTVEITLQASSPSNAILSAQAVLDEATGAGVGAFLCQDKSSPTTISLAEAAHVWVKKMSDLERGKEIGDVTWILETEELTINHAGMAATA